MTMRLKAALILVALFASILSPLTFDVYGHDDRTVLVTLDVCKASGVSLSVSAELPVIHEPFCNLLPPDSAFHREGADPEFKPFIITFQKDRPPRA